MESEAVLEIIRLGDENNWIKFFDSMHLALAEENRYDFLFTTDIIFLKTTKKLALFVKVMNPIEWILEEDIDE